MSPPRASLSSKRPAASSAGIDEEEAEAGGGDAVEAAQQAGRDGRAGAGDARAPARRPGRRRPRSRRPCSSSRSPRSWVATRSAYHITALQRDQAEGDHPQRAQVAGDDVLEQQAGDPDRDGADDDVPAHPVVELAAVLRLDQPEAPDPDDVPDVLGEVEDHRGDRAHLDHGGEAGDGGVRDVEAEDLLGDRQVAGAGHGEELGEPLHDAEDHGVEVVHRLAFRSGPRGLGGGSELRQPARATRARRGRGTAYACSDRRAAGTPSRRGGYLVAMQQRSVGATGLKVSRLGLGTMTWGRDTDEHEARDQLIAFVESGGTCSTPRPATAAAPRRS